MVLDRIRKLLHVLDFLVPMEVLLALFVVFSMENVLDYVVGRFAPESYVPEIWLFIALITSVLFGLARYATASDEEVEELEDELDDIDEA